MKGSINLKSGTYLMCFLLLFATGCSKSPQQEQGGGNPPAEENDGQFEFSEGTWTDGEQSDRVPSGTGITVKDGNATVIESSYIKGRYVKIGPDAAYPYKVTKTVIDNNPDDILMTADGGLPEWLEIRSATESVDGGSYLHEVVYLVTYPGYDTRYAITFPEGCTDDSEIITIGFLDPYPGTPLPCLSWGSNFYSPVHVNQSSYLVRNEADEAYFAGSKAFTINTTGNEFVNDVAASPCPEGWTELTDSEIQEFFEWVGGHLKTKESEGVYTFNLYGNPKEATNLRIQAGYARTEAPVFKDFACFGTWPNVAYVELNDDLSVRRTSYGNEWPVYKKYAVQYRCIRPMAGWN